MTLVSLRQKIAAVVAVVAIVGIVAGPGNSAPAGVPCSAGMRAALKQGNFETYNLGTLNMDVKVSKKSYKIGQTAVFNVTVTRPAKKDPAGAGVETPRPTTMPAEDVVMGVGLMAGDVYLYATGITDAQGKATLKVKIKSYTSPGTASWRMLGQYRRADSPCLVLDEFGYVEDTTGFKITR